MSMKAIMTKVPRAVYASCMCLVLGGCLSLLCGCSEEDYLDHEPPAGQGSLIVDNHTADDISIYVNGTLSGTVNNDSDATLDMDPGVYRVVLTERHDGDRSYAADVDVLEGRLTVMEVSSDSGNISRYDVAVTFED